MKALDLCPKFFAGIDMGLYYCLLSSNELSNIIDLNFDGLLYEMTAIFYELYNYFSKLFTHLFVSFLLISSFGKLGCYYYLHCFQN